MIDIAHWKAYAATALEHSETEAETYCSRAVKDLAPVVIQLIDYLEEQRLKIRSQKLVTNPETGLIDYTLTEDRPLHECIDLVKERADSEAALGACLRSRLVELKDEKMSYSLEQFREEEDLKRKRDALKVELHQIERQLDKGRDSDCG